MVLQTVFKFVKFTQRFISSKAPRVFDTVVKQQRGNLNMMKISREKWQCVMTPEVEQLVQLFDKYGYQIRMAGGAVRDILQGKRPEDIDFATNALPDEMKTMFTAENIRMLNMKGERHGTITVRINDKENFECTTLRIDVKTDGRHAEVEFTKDWALDAGRRDLTFNAMFLELNGTLHDYFGGREDLAARRVRFVGNPIDRIQEDYLRILRYFRFYSKIAEVADNHEQVTLKAIQDNGAGLAKISGERIWVELKKICIGRFAPELLRLMFKLGLGSYIGFSENSLHRTDQLCEIFNKLNGHSPEPVTALSSLLENENEALQLNKRLKLSNEEYGTILIILKYRGLLGEGKSLDWYKQLFAHFCYVDPRCRETQARYRVIELAKYCGDVKHIGNLQDWRLPNFPVEGYDLMNIGVPRGKKFGVLVTDLKTKWICSNFALSKENLLEYANDVVASSDNKNDRSPLDRK